MKVSQEASKTWSSPAFLKRKSLPASETFDFLYNPFADGLDEAESRSTKRTKFGRRSDQWRFVQRTPEVPPETGDPENVDQQLREHTEDGSTLSAGQHVASELAGNLVTVHNDESPVSRPRPQSHDVEWEVASPASLPADNGAGVSERPVLAPLTSPELPVVSLTSARVSEPCRDVDEEADYKDAQAPPIEASATVAQQLNTNTNDDSVTRVLTLDASEEYVYRESSVDLAAGLVPEHVASTENVSENREASPTDLLDDFPSIESSYQLQLRTAANEEALPQNLLKSFPDLPPIGFDGAVFSHQQNSEGDNDNTEESPESMHAPIDELADDEKSKLDSQLIGEVTAHHQNELDTETFHPLTNPPFAFPDESRLISDSSYSENGDEEDDYSTSEDEDEDDRSTDAVEAGADRYGEDLTHVDESSGETRRPAFDVVNNDSEDEQEEVYSENEGENADKQSDVLDDCRMLIEEDLKAQNLDNEADQAEEIDVDDYKALARYAAFAAEQEIFTSIVVKDNEDRNSPPLKPRGPLLEEISKQHQLLDFHGVEENPYGNADEGRQVSCERNPFPFTAEVSGLAASHSESEVPIAQETSYNGAPEDMDDDQSARSLPLDFSMVPNVALNSDLHNPLMTPLATQVEQKEEEDVRSQVNLDLLEADEDLLVSDSTQPLSEATALPVTPASSHPLLGTLRRLRSSLGVKPADTSSNRLSSQTEPWFSVRKNPKDTHIVEQTSSSESQDDPISEQYDDDVGLKSKRNSVARSESPLLEPEIESAPDSEEIPLVEPPPVGFRTPLSYFAPLSTLSEHFNSTIDTFAIAISATSPVRATNGPRDYYRTVYITDQSSAAPNSIPTHTVVQIFRPYQHALPVLATGDALLLRNFKVQTQNHTPMLLSTESSAWAVFRADTDVQIRGPHVQFGPEESGLAERLREWWRSLDAEMRTQAVDGVPRADKPGKGKGTAKEKARARRKRVSEAVVVHELRDGTRYTDGREDGITGVHELRDGTTYTDDDVVR